MDILQMLHDMNRDIKLVPILHTRHWQLTRGNLFATSRQSFNHAVRQYIQVVNGLIGSYRRGKKFHPEYSWKSRQLGLKLLVPARNTRNKIFLFIFWPETGNNMVYEMLLECSLAQLELFPATSHRRLQRPQHRSFISENLLKLCLF